MDEEAKKMFDDMDQLGGDYHHYILDEEGNPKVVPMRIWAEWINEPLNKILCRTELPGGIRVSTIFLSLNHNWGSGAPILWETMIFGGEYNDFQDRYCTRDEAIIGHLAAIDMVRSKKEGD